MAVQLKRQGVENAASCSDSPLKPEGLSYGEPAIDSSGYIYVGNGQGKVVSLTRFSDKSLSSSYSENSLHAVDSDALSGRKIGTGIFNSTTEFIPYVKNDGGLEIGNYIDFHEFENSSVDYNLKLTCNNHALKITDQNKNYGDVSLGNLNSYGWIKSYGDTGWVNGTYNSGWYMSDSSFLRIYNNKAIYTDNDFSGNWISITKRSAFTVGTAAPDKTSLQAKGFLSGKTNTGSWCIAGLYGADNLYFVWGSDANYDANKNTVNSKIYFDNNGYIHASKVYNAVYNDYAEFFPRGEMTEPGDIIALDTFSDKEQYIKATSSSKKIIGVHSDEYGHLIGGEEPPFNEDFVEYNIKKYIPIGLVGRCKVKVIGKVNKGDDIIPSEIPGVGRKWIDGIDSEQLLKSSIGFAVESSNDEDVKLIRVKLRG